MQKRASVYVLIFFLAIHRSQADLFIYFFIFLKVEKGKRRKGLEVFTLIKPELPSNLLHPPQYKARVGGCGGGGREGAWSSTHGSNAFHVCSKVTRQNLPGIALPWLLILDRSDRITEKYFLFIENVHMFSRY